MTLRRKSPPSSTIGELNLERFRSTCIDSKSLLCCCSHALAPGESDSFFATHVYAGHEQHLNSPFFLDHFSNGHSNHGVAQNIHPFRPAAPVFPSEPFLSSPSLSFQPPHSSRPPLSSSHLSVPSTSRRPSSANSTRSFRTGPYPELRPRSRNHSPNAPSSSPRTARSTSAFASAGRYMPNGRAGENRKEPRPQVEPILSYEEQQADLERRRREKAEFYAVGADNDLRRASY